MGSLGATSRIMLRPQRSIRRQRFHEEINNHRSRYQASLNRLITQVAVVGVAAIIDNGCLIEACPSSTATSSIPITRADDLSIPIRSPMPYRFPPTEAHAEMSRQGITQPVEGLGHHSPAPPVAQAVMRSETIGARAMVTEFGLPIRSPPLGFAHSNGKNTRPSRGHCAVAGAEQPSLSSPDAN